MNIFTLGGSTQKTSDFLGKLSNPSFLYNDLARLAQRGVDALSAMTPRDTTMTANSWGYEIEINSSKCTISWLNTNKAGDTSVAVLLQYGHGTGNGGYVQGVDYINPALEPIFKEISDSVWKKVTSA